MKTYGGTSILLFVHLKILQISLLVALLFVTSRSFYISVAIMTRLADSVRVIARAILTSSNNRSGLLQSSNHVANETLYSLQRSRSRTRRQVWRQRRWWFE